MNKSNKTFEGLAAIKAAVLTATPGLSNLPSDLKNEAGRQLSRGAMEIASALFGGSGYVQYGPGQSVSGPVNETAQEPAAELTPDHDHDGMER